MFKYNTFGKGVACRAARGHVPLSPKLVYTRGCSATGNRPKTLTFKMYFTCINTIIKAAFP